MKPSINRVIQSMVFVFLIMPASSLADNPLEPLAKLVGQCWAGDIGEKRIDTHCFRWMYEHQFVKEEHVVKSQNPDYLGETLYYWDTQTKSIRYFYWNSIGGLEQGTVLERDGRLIFPSVVDTPDGRKELETSIKFTDTACYQNSTREKTKDTWKVWFETTYCRIDSEP